MSQPQLILASGSPRRQQLLKEAGFTFRVLPAREGVEERAEQKAECEGLCSNCGPADLVADLAMAKGLDVVDQLVKESENLHAVVLAADTVAECDSLILGKPADAIHAKQMMRQLSGRAHRVYTGIFLAKLASGVNFAPERHAVSTTLMMTPLTEDWIDDYVASKKWQGKAGGFGYQDGLGFVHIKQGSESNVVGLPMELVAERLIAMGCISCRDGN